MDKRKVTKERKRLEDLLKRANVPQHQQDALRPVIENISWQRIKLDEAREQMQDANLIVHYNNGGGQEGERENPIFKAYITLWRAYMMGIDKYTSYLPKELKAEAGGEVISILDQVKQMKKAKA